MVRSDLSDFSGAYIVVKATIIVRNPDNNAYDKNLALKNNAPFVSCISEINNTLIDNAEDLDVVMPMYNLLDYSKSKVPSHPKALRPISLPDPLSKSLGVILAQRLGPYTQQYLATLPQHAYLAQRSTASPIGKVMSHCHQIRQLLQSQKLNIHSSRDGQRNSDLVGGLILSVDLSRAFDSLPFWLLRQSLDQAGVPGSLRELILSFHAHVRFKVANSDVSVLAGRGIRQGCPLAPQLWAIASGCITQMIAARTSPDFSRQGLTLYADDNLGSWLIQDLPCLCRGLREAAVILDVLSECGFEASTEKSIFILELRGRKARQALSNVTCVLADGKSKELELVDGYFR